MDPKCANDMRFYYSIGLDENLTWLTQNTKNPKRNKGKLTFLSNTVNVIEL